MHNSFYTEEELTRLGLMSYGKNVKISKKTSIYNAPKISLGDNVRIDDFCVLSGNITIGSYVHIAVFCALFGRHGIVFEDFTGISSRVTIYSAMDDLSGEVLTNPTISKEFTNVTGGKIVLKKHSVVGAGTIIFPKVTLGEGAAVGAMSLVTQNLKDWTINFGIPAKFLKERKKTLLELEHKLIEKYANEQNKI